MIRDIIVFKKNMQEGFNWQVPLSTNYRDNWFTI